MPRNDVVIDQLGRDDDPPLELVLAEMAQETRAFMEQAIAARGVEMKANVAHAISELEAA